MLSAPPDMSTKEIQKLIERLNIVVADQNQYARKLTRMMLMNIGAKSIYEAGDGVAALDTIRTANPDVAILDWEMPLVSGQDLIRIIRSPGVFPKPDLPIILLMAGADRLRVTEAIRLGVHEFLCKPTSPVALRDRLMSILLKPRPMVQIGKYYLPKLRRAASQYGLDAHPAK
jgi:two-component system, chemotaxis family, chemotaxis protein CheY